MNDDLDLARLGQIPDPFAAPSEAPPMKAARPPSPTRQAVRGRRAVVAAVIVLFEVGWVAFVEHRPDLPSLPPWTIAAGLAIPLLAGTLAFGAVSSRGRKGLGAPAWGLALLATLPPLLFAAITLAVNPPEPPGEPFWNYAVRCMALSAFLVSVPVALGAFAFRHAFPAASSWRTAALGVACGAVGAAIMSLVCPHGGALHVIVGHGSMMLVFGVVGALLGRRITRA